MTNTVIGPSYIQETSYCFEKKAWYKMTKSTYFDIKEYTW